MARPAVSIFSKHFFIYSDILPMLTFVEKKAVRQNTCFRGPLQIGSEIKINVYGYIRVSGTGLTGLTSLTTGLTIV